MKKLLALILALALSSPAHAITVSDCSFSNPSADRILFWDDSVQDCGILTPAGDLSITGTNLNFASGNYIKTNGTSTTSNIIPFAQGWTSSANSTIIKSGVTGTLFLDSGIFGLTVTGAADTSFGIASGAMRLDSVLGTVLIGNHSMLFNQTSVTPADTTFIASGATGTNVNGSSIQFLPGDSTGNGFSTSSLWASGGGPSGSSTSGITNVFTVYYDGAKTFGNQSPATTALYDLGASALHWRSGYINKLGNLTSNGFVKTGSSDGTLSVSSTINLASEVTGDLPLSNLAQGTALSVLGVTGNATADNASIVAGSDNQVLRRSGTSVGFGAVNLASTNAVTGDLPFSNIAQNSSPGVFANTSASAEDLGNILGYDNLPNYIFDNLEAGSAPDSSNTQIMLRDNGVGYTQAYPLSDVSGVLQTYLGSTTFGQPAQRIDSQAFTTSQTMTEFVGTYEMNATSGALTVTTAALISGRTITVIKTDASINAVTVQTNIFGGSVVLATQGQSVTIRKSVTGSTWYKISTI